MILWLFFYLISWAEYRAFEHAIVNTETKETRTIASQLDPDQYPGYFPVKANEYVVMKSTWMCYGDTSYSEKICPNPRLENKEAPVEQSNP